MWTNIQYKITWAFLSTCPYLHERVIPPPGDTLSGFFIPGGVNIGFNLFGLLLNSILNQMLKGSD